MDFGRWNKKGRALQDAPGRTENQMTKLHLTPLVTRWQYSDLARAVIVGSLTWLIWFALMLVVLFGLLG